MIYLYFLIFFILISIPSILKFNSFVKNTYYEYHQIYKISDNYKENYRDPFF